MKKRTVFQSGMSGVLESGQMPRSPLASLYGTPRFATYYRSASPSLKIVIRSKAFDFGRRFLQHQAQAMASYGRVKYLERHCPGLVEVDIGAACRAIVKVQAGRAVVLNAGDHDLIAGRRYTPQMLKRDLASEVVPLSGLFGHALILSAEPQEQGVLEDALDPRWLYHLDDDQQRCADEILCLALQDAPHTTTFLVLGGPGTGKTSVLLQVADLLGPDPRKVQLDISDEMASYVRAGLGPCLDACRLNRQTLERDTVLLVDDPKSWSELEDRQVNLAAVLARIDGSSPIPSSPPKLTVIAADPGQFGDNVPDEVLSRYMSQAHVQSRVLKQCYRQKEALGRQAVHYMRCVTERFSKFNIPQRRQAFLDAYSFQNRQMNDLDFVCPGGYCHVYEGATTSDIEREVRAVRNLPRWRHWPCLLLAVDEGVDCRSFVGRALGSVRHRIVSLGDVDTIRGVEFQHVFILLTLARLHELEHGRHGLGTKEYVAARNLRIPFSRATDRLVVFAIDD